MVRGAGKTEDGLVQYNEEVNKLGDDLMELYKNALDAFRGYSGQDIQTESNEYEWEKAS